MDKNIDLKNEESNVFVKFFNSIFNRKTTLTERKARAGYAFVLPFILGVVLIYIPILIDSIWLGFHDVMREVPKFVGLQYYQEAFATPNFTVALLAGLQQLVFEVPAIIVFSLFIAVVLNNKMLGRAAFRAIFFIPVIISTGIME